MIIKLTLQEKLKRFAQFKHVNDNFTPHSGPYTALIDNNSKKVVELWSQSADISKLINCPRLVGLSWSLIQ